MTTEMARRSVNNRESAPLWVKLYRSRKTPGEVVRMLGIEEPPVPITNLARDLGAEVYLVEDKNWHGAVDADVQTGDASIYVHKEMPETRQRFTIAHEIGHLILHEKQEIRLRDTNFLENNREEEAQANGYAAGLLMPEFMMDNITLAITDPYKLAKTFFVSPAAMKARLNKLYG